MPQSRLRDYKEPIDSFLHNIFNLGFHAPGRYRGFNTFQITGPLTFTLAHNSISYIDGIGTTYGPIGVLLGNQGIIIMETDPILGLAVESNAGNNSDRYDYIVCTHSFDTTVGGTPATYSIIKGPLGNSIPPALGDPLHQIIIGTVLMVANQTTLGFSQIQAPGGQIYFKGRCPDSGDGIDARIDEVNKYQRQQQFNQATDTTGLAVNGYIDLSNDGNTYRIIVPGVSIKRIKALRFSAADSRNGTTLDLYIDGNVEIVQAPAAQLTLVEKNLGYRLIQVPQSIFNGKSLEDWQRYMTTLNSPVILRMILIQDYWYITQVTRLIVAAVGTAPTYKILYRDSVYLGNHPAGSDEMMSIDITAANVPIAEAGTYSVQCMLRSVGADFNADNDVILMLRTRTQNAFEILLRSFNSSVKDLWLDYVIITLA